MNDLINRKGNVYEMYRKPNISMNINRNVTKIYLPENCSQNKRQYGPFGRPLDPLKTYRTPFHLYSDFHQMATIEDKLNGYKTYLDPIREQYKQSEELQKKTTVQRDLNYSGLSSDPKYNIWNQPKPELNIFPDFLFKSEQSFPRFESNDSSVEKPQVLERKAFQPNPEDIKRVLSQLEFSYYKEREVLAKEVPQFSRNVLLETCDRLRQLAIDCESPFNRQWIQFEMDFRANHFNDSNYH